MAGNTQNRAERAALFNRATADAEEALFLTFGCNSRELPHRNREEALLKAPEVLRTPLSAALFHLALTHQQTLQSPLSALELFILAQRLNPADFTILKALETSKTRGIRSAFGGLNGPAKWEAITSAIEDTQNAFKRFMVYGLGIHDADFTPPAHEMTDSELSGAFNNFTNLQLPEPTTQFGSEAWDQAQWCFENLALSLVIRGRELSRNPRSAGLAAQHFESARNCALHAVFLLTDELALERLKPLLLEGRLALHLAAEDPYAPRRLARALRLASEAFEAEGYYSHAYMALSLGRTANAALKQVPCQEIPLAQVEKELKEFDEKLRRLEKDHPGIQAEARRTFTLTLEDTHPELAAALRPQPAKPELVLPSELKEAIEQGDWNFLCDFVCAEFRPDVSGVLGTLTTELRKAKLKLSVSLQEPLEGFARESLVVQTCGATCAGLYLEKCVSGLPARPNFEHELVTQYLGLRVVKALVSLSGGTAEAEALNNSARNLEASFEDAVKRLRLGALKSSLSKACDAIELSLRKATEAPRE